MGDLRELRPTYRVARRRISWPWVSIIVGLLTFWSIIVYAALRAFT